jgi:uroporphyrinogen decarboxylase
MRPEVTERFYRTFTYQSVDRVPDIEFGYWPQTIRRWRREGLTLELSEEEANQMFLRKLDDFLGFEAEGHGIPLAMGMNPEFDERVLERRSSSVIMQTRDGILAERYLNDVDDSSIPHFLRFPVETPADWAGLKQRYRLDDPIRCASADAVAEARRAQANGHCISCFVIGFYGQLRNWMGMERLAYALYDHPEMIEDMVVHWSELAVRQLRALPPDLVIDQVNWWEDMASKNGPLLSPALFRRFLQPGYHRVMEEARRRGCCLATVDCDGNPHDLVGCWLEEGVNIMFPLEVAAGVDPYAWRREFGRELRLRGGVAKRPLVAGGTAIDAELERIRPLLEQGGFIPHLDHLVPPDIPYDHYREYLDKKRRLIGK